LKIDFWHWLRQLWVLELELRIRRYVHYTLVRLGDNRRDLIVVSN